MHIGAIEAGGTKFILGIGNEHANILDRVSIPTTTPKETMKKVIHYFKDKSIDAIGLSCFGPIDTQKSSLTYGSITTTPKTQWKNYNIVKLIKKYYNVPIGFDTDVNGAALGELLWGAAVNLKSIVYITVGTGIGAGVIIERKSGFGIFHPEVGHIMIKRHEDDEYVGNCPYHKDCLEGMASGTAIAERWKKKPVNIEPKHLAWEFESYYLAQAVVNLILTLAPEKIIMGGGIMKQTHLFPLIRKKVRDILSGYINRKEVIEINEDYIVPPKLKDNAGLCGAVALGLRTLKDSL